MFNIRSDFLSKRKLKALLKIGEFLGPKNDLFPSFSECGCIHNVDDTVANSDPKVLSDLKLFFKIKLDIIGFKIKTVTKSD